jgi:hypothetical protein
MPHLALREGQRSMEKSKRLAEDGGASETAMTVAKLRVAHDRERGTAGAARAAKVMRS